MRTRTASTLVLLAFGFVPAVASAQQPPSDELYAPMPPPTGQPPAYGQPDPNQPYAQPNPYGEGWQPGEGGTQAPGGEVGYDDAGAEAWQQEQADSDAGYVDDGYDSEAWIEYETTLSPYGSWVNTADYGRVWYPSTQYVGADFMPYSSGGHWVLTEYGWTWVSDWDWGWAPFHYGRWMTMGSYGWCWIPGRVWGPSWVTWRWGGGYVGWAPLPPRGVRIPAPPPAGAHGSWRFTHASQLGGRSMSFVGSAQARSVFSSTTPMRNVQTINRYRVEAGPHPQVVSTVVGRGLQPMGVHQITGAAPRATIVPRLPPTAFTPRVTTPGYRGLPAYHQPMAAQPGFRAPVQGPPAWRAPAASQPAWRSPSPSNAAPAWRSPSPSYNAPSYNAPAFRPSPSPTYTAPSYNAPAFRPSPTYNAPSYNAPAFRPSPSPSYNAPAFRPSPSPSYNAPAFRPSPAPSYNAPAFRPSPSPSYNAPSFRPSPAPSFSAPSRPSFSAPSAAPRPSMHFGGGRR